MRKFILSVLVVTAVAFTACENSRVSTYPKGTPSYSDAMVNNNAEALKLGDSLVAAQEAAKAAAPAPVEVAAPDTTIADTAKQTAPVAPVAAPAAPVAH